ncbi:MAG: LptE family protein [Chitinophagales bacterium]
MKAKSRYIVLIMGFVALLTSCKIYSFSGANIDPAIQTVSITYFNNNSGNGPASASDLFTEALKQKILRETNLRLVNGGGDVHFEGEIVDYTYTIQAPSGNETSDLRRITMAVKVSYIDYVTGEEGFKDQQFSRYVDYPVSEDISGIEDALIDEINTLLVDDIFNKAFVKW